jgi:hypothetical protein
MAGKDKDEDKLLIFAGVKTGTGFKLLNEAPASKLSPKLVEDNLKKFVASVGALLPNLAPGPAGFRIDEYTVAVGIDGKGSVGFLGTGAELGASATLTIKFARPK